MVAAGEKSYPTVGRIILVPAQSQRVLMHLACASRPIGSQHAMLKGRANSAPSLRLRIRITSFSVIL
jgi:hypothetical protein